jgi:hypothetical protein
MGILAKERKRFPLQTSVITISMCQKFPGIYISGYMLSNRIYGAESLAGTGSNDTVFSPDMMRESV